MLILAHPQMVNRTCDECRKWIYDDTPAELSSTVKTWHGQPMKRERGAPCPCHRCPKAKSPEAGEKIDAAVVKAFAVLEKYYQVKATSGLVLSESERSDSIVQRNLGICEELVRMSEQVQLAKMMAVRRVTS